MRRLFSIALIILVLLNTLGYYGIFLGWQYRTDREMTQKLDSEDYSHSETLTIALPLTIPYASDSRDFERVNGKFEHNGEFYRLVKQKLYKDTLYIVCVKDHQTKEIAQALADYVKTFADSPLDAKSAPNGKAAFTFIKDYITSSIGLKPQNTGWVKTIIHHYTEVSPTAPFHNSINHPPEA